MHDAIWPRHQRMRIRTLVQLDYPAANNARVQLSVCIQHLQCSGSQDTFECVGSQHTVLGLSMASNGIGTTAGSITIFCDVPSNSL